MEQRIIHKLYFKSKKNVYYIFFLLFTKKKENMMKATNQFPITTKNEFEILE